MPLTKPKFVLIKDEPFGFLETRVQIRESYNLRKISIHL